MEISTKKKYNRIKLYISLLSLLIDLLFWIFLIISDIPEYLASLAYNNSSTPLLQFYLFIIPLSFGLFIINLPISFYSGYLLEHRFSLSNQKLFEWVREQIKGLTIGIILGSILITVFFLLLWTYPNHWWIGIWLFVLFFSILMVRIVPILIFPLFYRLKPLESQSLKQKIKNFAENWKIRILDVFEFNLSKTTKKANAAFTGLGKTKRVLLADTLLENFSEQEIEAVFAHEVGHYRKRHLIKRILINSLLSFFSLYIVFKIYNYITLAYNYSPAQLEALPYLGLIFFIYGVVSDPLGNLVSRYFEYQADHFAVVSTHNNENYKNVLKKLADLNLVDETPHPWVEFLFHSHPSIINRINKISEDKL
jgi:STE24 endopeptidase